MQSKLFLYSFLGIFFFASLTETVFSKWRLTTRDQGDPRHLQRSIVKDFGIDRVDRPANPEQTIQKSKHPVQNSPLKSRFKEMFAQTTSLVTLFMCGDVMLGRGIDQVLPHPSDPEIYEQYMRSAKGYVKIAERMNGPIPSPVSCSYIWGDALEELERVSPDLRIINLETSVTKSNDYWKNKGINYRMNPENIVCLTAAKIVGT